MNWAENLFLSFARIADSNTKMESEGTIAPSAALKEDRHYIITSLVFQLTVFVLFIFPFVDSDNRNSLQSRCARFDVPKHTTTVQLSTHFCDTLFRERPGTGYHWILVVHCDNSQHLLVTIPPSNLKL